MSSLNLNFWLLGPVPKESLEVVKTFGIYLAIFSEAEMISRSEAPSPFVTAVAGAF